MAKAISQTPAANAKDAINLAKLGLPVKKMIGGRMGWLDEGFELVQEDHASTV